MTLRRATASRAALLCVLVGGLMAAGCGAKSAEDLATEDFVSRIQVAGYRKADVRERSGDVVLTFVGPSSADPAKIVSAPGFSFSDAAPVGLQGARPFEYLAEDNDVPFMKRSCRMSVTRLVQESADRGLLQSLNLQTEEVEAAALGDMAVLQIVTRCR